MSIGYNYEWDGDCLYQVFPGASKSNIGILIQDRLDNLDREKVRLVVDDCGVQIGDDIVIYRYDSEFNSWAEFNTRGE